MTAKWIVREPE